MRLSLVAKSAKWRDSGRGARALIQLTPAHFKFLNPDSLSGTKLNVVTQYGDIQFTLTPPQADAFLRILEAWPKIKSMRGDITLPTTGAILPDMPPKSLAAFNEAMGIPSPAPLPETRVEPEPMLGERNLRD